VTVAAIAQPARGGIRPEKGRLTLHQDGLRWALFVLVIFTVSRLHQYNSITTAIRPVLLLTFVVAGYAYVNPKLINATSLIKYWPAKVMLALVVLACLSVPFGISIGNSGRFILEAFSKNVILAFLLIAGCRTVRDLYSFAWAYVLGCGVLSYLAIFVFKLQQHGADDSYARLVGLHNWDANDIAVVLTLGFALTLVVLQSAKDLPRRLICLIVLVGIAGTLARSGSRGGFIGFLAIGAAVLLLTWGVSIFKKVLFVAVAAAALFLFAPPGYWEQMETIKELKKDYNYTELNGRKAVAKRGIGYMKDHPIFGIGINNFTKAECTISDKAKNKPPGGGIRCTPPHNSFVQAGAELGVPGLLLWSSLLLGGIGATIRLRSRIPKEWSRGTEEERFLFYCCQYFPVGIIGFTVTVFFLTFAWLEIYYILAAFLVGLMFCVDRQLGRRSPVANPEPVRRSSRPVRRSGWRSHPLPRQGA